MERCLLEALEHDPDGDRHEFWRGGLAMQSLAKDLEDTGPQGQPGLQRHLRADWHRKVRHMCKIEMARIAGKDNPADVLTKFVSREDLDSHCRSFGFAATAGRTTGIAER